MGACERSALGEVLIQDVAAILAIGTAVALAAAVGVGVDLAVLDLDRDGRAQRPQDELGERLAGADLDRLVRDVARAEDRPGRIGLVRPVLPVEDDGRRHGALQGAAGLGHDLGEPAAGGHEGQAGGDGQGLARLEGVREAGPLRVQPRQVDRVDVPAGIGRQGVAGVLLVRHPGSQLLGRGVDAELEHELLAHGFSFRIAA
ncbi:MAG: hypothetical protein COU35_03280 [Candidatus Magasanikbacteria bacterium CG10_big_fil_rev_8_21_14_0_10_47_10]|uniref:Uncharacterized protein n=1 Tax=Candidatus Magasanikbacteria bacterium CG10_big_fil_rev_8_21_14_0_10_47_10 TaxID=1974652 RepID=A0A2H0TQ79_9BACT|nr:MAG: hypothetical protein COU35_03280 [Candidatus Magasanikbacteria bacterium CG10_big_fil_rev_8_21_14_0_10_47_10]